MTKVNEYLENLEVGTSVKLTLKKGESLFFYRGEITSNNSNNEYLVVKDIKKVEIYCKYEAISDIEVASNE